MNKQPNQEKPDYLYSAFEDVGYLSHEDIASAVHEYVEEFPKVNPVEQVDIMEFRRRSLPPVENLQSMIMSLVGDYLSEEFSDEDNTFEDEFFNNFNIRSAAKIFAENIKKSIYLSQYEHYDSHMVRIGHYM